LAQLLILRFVLGFILAITISTTYTYAAEISPKRFVARAVVFATLGYSIGVAAGGALSSWLIAIHGWRSVFVAAGVISLLTAVLAGVFLPESARFLASKGRPTREIRRAIRQIARSLPFPPNVQFSAADARTVGLGVAQMLAEGRLHRSVRHCQAKREYCFRRAFAE
jgi:AAHS family 4-hydroxybenzoate transporter-like MFS transporter